MVRRFFQLIINKLDKKEDWSSIVEDTILCMGIDLNNVDLNYKLRMMRGVALLVADLKHDRDYWRDEALKNASEADNAERRAKIWKCAAKSFRSKLKF
jgi:hypothetical protein